MSGQLFALYQHQLCTAQWGSQDSRTHSETGVMYTGGVHKRIMHEQYALQTRMIQESITSQWHAGPVAIYSNMTHFHVCHIDVVSVHSNGDTGDSKLTGA